MPPDTAELTFANDFGSEELEAIRSVLVAAVRHHCPHHLLDDAEDLVQVAMLKVLATWRPNEGRRVPPSSYLWRVTYSVVIDEIRARRRRREVAMDEAISTEPPTDLPTPERAALSRQEGAFLSECLRGLLPARRRAVTLRLQGHRVAEVGRLLGWSAKRAENLVYRALADLRACLAEKGVRP